MMRHNAIIVYSWNKVLLNKAYEKAVSLFGKLVSPVINSSINEYKSFFVAPDGSKEYWDESDQYNALRSMLCDFIDSLAYDDGSSAVEYVDASFGETYDGRTAEIDRHGYREKKELVGVDE